jgi:Zn-dependent protease with chaperone function
MTAPSLIAFGFVFLATSMVLSLLLGICLRILNGRLRSLGAWAERRAATLMLVAPPLVSLLLVGVLAAESAWSLFAGTDHCTQHSHHLHICLVHGAEWAARPLAVGLLVVMGVLVALRLGHLTWSHVQAQRAAWRFRRLGEPLTSGRCAVLAPLDQPMVFTAGALSPTIVISRGAWDGLSADERRAVLEHELTHVRGGDIWRRALLALLSGLGVPGFASCALHLWDRAAERICDRSAASAVGKPSVVAQAIVSLARGMSHSAAPAGAVFAAACSISERVHSLLEVEADGARFAAQVSRWFVVAIVGTTLVSAATSAELHHILETILG